MSACETRYPIYIPTKGRHDPKLALTVRFLKRDGCEFRVVVDPSEAEEYARLVGDKRVIVLPDSHPNVPGTRQEWAGCSIFARNYIMQHSIEEGHERHWQLDDNIRDIRRTWRGRRIPINAGLGLRVCEELTDRYENVGISGLNYQMFVTDETREHFYLNCHVYSCTLVNNRNHELVTEGNPGLTPPEYAGRWRLRYNEDTDICLQVLSAGLCTILINVVVADKLPTLKLPGGNMEVLYKGDGRWKMADLLASKWPHAVKVDRRFQRPQHVVNWKLFGADADDDPWEQDSLFGGPPPKPRGHNLNRPYNNKLVFRAGKEPFNFKRLDEWGMKLRSVEDVKADTMKQLVSDWKEDKE